MTCVPLGWLVAVTYTASYQKIFSPAPRIGFLAQAAALQSALDAGVVPAAEIAATQAQIFNSRLDAALCGVFVVLVTTILIDSVRVWAGVAWGRRDARVKDTPFVLSTLRVEEL